MSEIASAPVEPQRMSWKTAGGGLIAIALVAIGDLLIFGHTPGINLFVFAAAIAVSILLLYRDRLDLRRVAIAATACLALSLPLIEAPSLAGVFCGLVGLGILALVASGRFKALLDLPFDAIRFALVAPFRVFGDGLAFFLGAATGTGLGGRLLRGALVWIVPAILAVVFVLLFSLANPLIEIGLTWLDPAQFLDRLDPWRVVFWVLLAALVWPFLRPKLLTWTMQPEAQGPALPKPENLLFGKAAILRSLIVFNALFAVQTALDLTYLWGGLALPDGMSYAHYAHRGAYPLIVTALLAAAFVLAAMRRGGPAEGSVWVRRLVYLWIGQNVLLVISSIFRLWLYVEVYSLTEMRIAAGIWMALVAVGLVLICVRIALDKSNLWLIALNLNALGFAIYVSAFLDAPAIISRFNVEHSRELSGQGVSLDICYLSALGPTVIPALDEFIERAAPPQTDNMEECPADDARQWLSVKFMERPDDWRSWSFRDHRLAAYLAGSPPIARSPQTEQNGATYR